MERREYMRFNKREFLKISMITALSAYLDGITGLEKILYAQEGPPPFLTDQERAVFHAIIGHLIPADQEPGVLELGLGSMIETFLRVTPQARPLIKPGLQGIEESVKTMWGKNSFLELTPKEKDRLFQELKSGRVKGKAWEKISSKEFFSTIRMFTVGLYYSNPKVWSFIGYSGPAQPKGHPDYHLL
jgi:hypothetical protein